MLVRPQNGGLLQKQSKSVDVMLCFPASETLVKAKTNEVKKKTT